MLVGLIGPPSFRESTSRGVHMTVPYARYGGSISDVHVCAAARAAMLSQAFDIDLGSLTDVFASDVARRAALAQEVLPVRWLQLAAAWPVSAPAAEHLLAVFTLGERHAWVLSASATGSEGLSDEMSTDVGLLGGLFNTLIVAIDQVTDSADTRLLGALTPPVLDALLDPASTSNTVLDDMRTAGGDAAGIAVELMSAWVELARSVYARSGNTAAWVALCDTLGALLTAQRTASGVDDDEGDAQAMLASARLKSEGPSTAIAQMVALALRPDHRVPERLWSSAQRLGQVFCVVDDLADVVADAREGRPNTHLLRTHPAGGLLTDPEVYAVIDSAASVLAQVCAPTGDDDVDAFAVEVVARWLHWDEQERRVPEPVAPRRGQDVAAERAVRFLVDSQAAGFPGSEHALTLPRGRSGEGGGTTLETHSDDVFARAVVLDSLLDALDAGLMLEPAVLYREAVRLLLAKHPVARGGWSYLGSVPELPPDADDLAAIMRVLVRLGGRPLAGACDEAVRLTLDGTEASGGFPTWIVQRHPATVLDAQMVDYVKIVGGGGVHPDVVAHLADSLRLADQRRYGRAVAGCAAYLAGAQEPDGSWRSAWYAGPYYGTFRAARVLGTASAWPDSCERAQAFLVRRQSSHGGWGTGEDETLSTAFAVLALHALAPRECADVIAAGADRLRATQQPDGDWPSGPWIAFPTRGGTVSYSSPATTTAFGLSALLCAGAPSPSPAWSAR